jgi:cyclopropane fatty-acyl-phospholipid synthase-like methyltransferase
MKAEVMTSDSEASKTAANQTLDRVRGYWDDALDPYLTHVGTTFQAGRIIDGGSMRESNLWLARAAGLAAGQRVLDAGCGVCGPSIDIARAIPGLRIVGVTISPRQATTARTLISGAGLAERVHVVNGDYQQLPFAAGMFDTVFFFESLGYASSLGKLFRGVRRVLRPGGTLYIKDVFRHDHLWSDQESRELAEFNRVYAQRTPKLTECIKAAAAAGFTDISHRELSEIVSTTHAQRAMFEGRSSTLSSFGRLHFRRHSCLPVYFAQLNARTP